ncbi:hypothetical protein AsGV026 [Agrotis segetum granulovirus]|uniref:Uncharacterized protein n=1 Tax=Agrotis segetum granulosis virus TaxID=10464 RepID=A0A0H4BEP6_GVAS|nr:hypothetical protein AsGV026 [Agrotis segetum granulovirus]AKN63300.1 hypothetical protein AsGV026 [Agrotis segetum granulovirus]
MDPLFVSVYEFLIRPNSCFSRPTPQTPQHFLYKLFKIFQAHHRKDYKEVKSVLSDLLNGVTIEENNFLASQEAAERFQMRLKRESVDFEKMYARELKRAGSEEARGPVAKKVCARRKTCFAMVQEAAQEAMLPPFLSPFPPSQRSANIDSQEEEESYIITKEQNNNNNNNDLFYMPSYEPSGGIMHTFTIPSPCNENMLSPSSSVIENICSPPPVYESEITKTSLVYTSSDDEEEGDFIEEKTVKDLTKKKEITTEHEEEDIEMKTVEGLTKEKEITTEAKRKVENKKTTKVTTKTQVAASRVMMRRATVAVCNEVSSTMTDGSSESSSDDDDDGKIHKKAKAPRRVRKKSPKGISCYVDNNDIVCMIGGVSYMLRAMKTKEVLIYPMVDGDETDLSSLWANMSDLIIEKYRGVEKKRNKRLTFNTLDYKRKCKEFLLNHLTDLNFKRFDS